MKERRQLVLESGCRDQRAGVDVVLPEDAGDAPDARVPLYADVKGD